MGITIDRREFKQLRGNVAQALFVLEVQKHLPVDVETINIGLELSDILKASPREKLPPLKDMLEQLISGKSADLILSRIDFLFDPIWNCNVLKLLLAVGRNRRFYVVWPGAFEANALSYSIQHQPDWANYNVSEYNDLYIVKK